MSSRRPSLFRTVPCLLRDLTGPGPAGTDLPGTGDGGEPVLRKQLALYRERRTKPRRPDRATRVTLVLLSRWLDWSFLAYGGATGHLIRWHRRGWGCSG